MDQAKIGKYIAECRKEKSLTQIQLAEKLGITNKAVSKWETGKSLPDASIMLDLCDVLHITVTELLCGESIETEKINEKSGFTLLELLNCGKKMRVHKFISEMMGGGGTGILLSLLYAPDTTRKAITAIIACIMICCGWYCRAKIEKNKFSYSSKDR